MANVILSDSYGLRITFAYRASLTDFINSKQLITPR